MDRVDSSSWINDGRFRIATRSGGEIIVPFLHPAMEKIEIDVRVVGACTAQSHVGGTFREGLHWRGTYTAAIAVGVAGIERTIVVEHSSPVDTRNIQLINDIKSSIFAARPRFAIFATTLTLATSFASALVVVIKI
jgi:hypothetical protein